MEYNRKRAKINLIVTMIIILSIIFSFQIFKYGRIENIKLNNNQKSISNINIKANDEEIYSILGSELKIQDIKNNFKIQNKSKDKLGFTIIKLKQIKHGLDVEKSNITVVLDKEGKISNITTNINYNMLNQSKIDILFTKDQAICQLNKYFINRNAKIAYKNCVYITKNKKNYGAYSFIVRCEKPKLATYEVFMDYTTNKIVKVEVLSRRMEIEGKTVNGENRSIEITNGKVENSINNNTLIQTYNAHYNEKDEDDELCNADKVNDKCVVSAQSYANIVYNFYKKEFNRNSLDNKGMSIKSYVHYGGNMCNAYWDQDRIIYGDGDNEDWLPFCGDLNIVGHELTHGVIQNTAGLKYEEQPGALNESISDVFGVLIKTWDKYNVVNGGTWKFDPNDWIVGEDIYTPDIDCDFVRCLYSPRRGGQSDNMNMYNELPNDEEHDYGGVHTNSGIPNKAAYLIAKNLGCEKTAQIYYRALTTYFNENTDFKGALNGIKLSAKDLYGEDSNEVKVVVDSFKQVGIIENK